MTSLALLFALVLAVPAAAEEPVTEPTVAAEDTDPSSPSLRMLGAGVGMLTGTIGGAAIGGALVGMGYLFCTYVCLSLGVAVGVVGGLTMGALGAWVGHQLAGGKGHYGFALLGALIGDSIAIGVFLATIFAGNGFVNPAPVSPLWILCGAAFLAAPIISLELNHLTKRVQNVGVSAAPLPGGAQLAFGFRF